MARQTMTSFTAGQAITLGGVAYVQGATIPPAVVAALANANALLSRRWIIPNVDPHSRRTLPSRPTPTSMTPEERRAILG